MRRVLSGGFLVRGLGAGASVLLNVVVARTMELDAAGLFLLTISMMLFLSSVMRFGSDAVTIRLLSGPLSRHADRAEEPPSGPSERPTTASAPRDPSTTFTTLVVLVLTAFVISTALLAAAAWSFGDAGGDGWGRSPVVWALPVLTLLYSGAFSLSSVGLASGRIVEGLATRNVVSNLATAVLVGGVALVVAPVPLWAAYVCLAVGLAAAAIVALRRFVRKAGLALTTVRASDVTGMARFSVPYVLTSFFEQALLWGGQLASAALLSTGDIARLASAQRVAMVLAFGLMVVNSVIAPRFAAAHDEGLHTRIARLYQRSLLLSAGIGIPVFVVLFVAARPIMGLFGPAYLEASSVLRILLIGQLVNVLTGPATQRLLMTGRERIVAVSYGVAAIASFGAFFLVVPVYGLQGMAVVMAIGLSAHKAVLILTILRGSVRSNSP
ncbi:MAG: MATE family efflux transporter [Trueperaceae bacterium]